MAEKEYIEREALIRYTEKQEVIIKDGTSIEDAMRIQGNVFRRCVETCPTANVVPKSEVDWHREAELNAKRIMELEVELEAMRGAANSYKMHYENLAREIFEEIENLSVNTVDDWGNSVQIIGEIDYAELKKKYAEE